ncbi:polymerase [Enterococcus faecium]|nr:polymerase [Enterococcus faecium]
MNERFLKYVKGWYFIYFGFILMLRAIGPYLLLPTRYDTLLFWRSQMKDIGRTKVREEIRFHQAMLDCLTHYQHTYCCKSCESSLMNLKYGYSENIKLIMWQLISNSLVAETIRMKFGQKVPAYRQENYWKQTHGLDISRDNRFVIQYGIKIPIKYKYYPVRLGWLGNRLFGVYTDPNFGAVISLIVIIIAIYYLVTYKHLNLLFKIFFVINIFIQFSFIALSGSRTTLVCLLITTFVFSFFTSYSSRFLKTNTLKRWLTALVVGLLSIIAMYYVTDITAHAWAHVPHITEVKKDTSDSSGTTSSNKVDLKRPDTDSGDVSNLRFELWKSAIEIFKSKPISGGSPGYYIEYAHDKLPYTLMGKDTLTAHNFIFLVMAATGGLGLLTLLTFLFIQCFKALRYCFTQPNLVKDKHFFAILMILTIAVSALFITELILVSTIGSFIFWGYLGSIQKTISKEEGVTN